MLRALVACGSVLSMLFLMVPWQGCLAPDPDNVPVSDTLAAEPQLEYGISTDSFTVIKGHVQKNQSLSQILQKYGVQGKTVHEIAEASKDVWDVRKLAAGRPLTVFCSKDAEGVAKCFVYESSDKEYVVFDLRDSLNVYVVQRPVERKLRLIEGEIRSSLYAELEKLGHSPALAVELSEIFAWTVDFYRIQKGDRFFALYEEDVVEGQSVGIGRIRAANFESGGKANDAHYFEVDGLKGYYASDGQSLKKAFLQAPLKFSRISSAFSKGRLHPVLKTLRPHLGTDYAAPHGTPIMAVGDGTVSEARYTSGNGNYVKIRHNKTYETQYLHMSKFRSGISKGVRVRQGEVIGYVGSTGLATGPHVCFRFWKNGKQIDHRKEVPPRSEPIPADLIERFKQVVSRNNAQADSLRRVVS
jgi:murein DD-endopeptidase MepM/ murein hydrolase activator NlpD